MRRSSNRIALASPTANPARARGPRTNEVWSPRFPRFRAKTPDRRRSSECPGRQRGACHQTLGNPALLPPPWVGRAPAVTLDRGCTSEPGARGLRIGAPSLMSVPVIIWLTATDIRAGGLRSRLGPPQQRDGAAVYDVEPQAPGRDSGFEARRWRSSHLNHRRRSCAPVLSHQVAPDWGTRGPRGPRTPTTNRHVSMLLPMTTVMSGPGLRLGDVEVVLVVHHAEDVAERVDHRGGDEPRPALGDLLVDRGAE